MRFFVSSGFGLLPTPTACFDTEWTNTVLVVVVVVVVDITGRTNNGLTAHNLRIFICSGLLFSKQLSCV